MMIKFSRMIIMTIGCLSFFLSADGLRAEQKSIIPPEAVEISNKIILNIYQDIFDAKIGYPELQNFGEENLFKNRHGIYGIRYADKNLKTGDPYRMGVTISTMDDIEFSGEEERFNYGFAKVNLKITGFQQKHPLRTQFDMMPLVTKYGMMLAQYQQEFMPLRIFIKPVKDVFKVKEDIEFDVILENVTKRHMIIKSLGQDTLYFLINNQEWGTSPLSGRSGGTDEILKSGQQTVLRFKGESFQRPQKVEITCFYRMSIDAVNPIGKVGITIEE